MNPILLGLIAVIGLGAFLYWLDRMIESDRVGLYLVLGISASDVLIDPPRLEPGGIAVDHIDVLLVVLIASLVARLLRGWRPSPMVSVLILIYILITFSIARGSTEFGIPASINEARDTLYLFATILYASFLRSDRPTRVQVGRAWMIFCQALVAISLLRWAIVLTGLPLRGEWFSDDYWGLRVVTSGEALSIAQGALILLPRILRGEATLAERRLAGVFAASVFMLQHRSVYAVMLCGAAVMIWRHRFLLDRRFVMTMIASSVLAAAAFVSVLDSGELAEQASTADASSTVTFEWRAAGWVALLQDSAPSGPEDVLFGTPYGSGYERVLATGERVDVAPHNQYLELMLRIGIVGLGLVLLVGFGTWSRLRTAVPSTGDPLLSDATLAALFITYMLYMIPYNIVMETGVLIGISISAHTARPPARSTLGTGGSDGVGPGHRTAGSVWR